MNATAPLILAFLVLAVLTVAGIVELVEGYVQRRYVRFEDPCPACATDGVVVFHTPETCAKDWRP